MQRAAQSSYQQAFGAIGRYLDQHRYDSLVLCELDDGFVARAVRNEGLPEAIPFPSSDMHNLIRLASEEGITTRGPAPPPPLPGGTFIQRTVGSYRGFLSALGRQCDQLEAGTVTVLELADSVLVCYQKSLSVHDSWETCSYEYLYDEQGVHALLAGGAASARR